MTASEPSHRADGKRSFDGIYDQADPSAYYTTLKPLRYQIPQHAQPIFRRAARAIGRLRDRAPIEMLDLCCGYGVNGALLNHTVSMDELYAHYRRPPVGVATRQQRIERDSAFFRRHRLRQRLARVTGIDVAGNALGYSRSVGLLDDALRVDLEGERPDAEARSKLERADLITVTGGLSYIGACSFRRLLDLFPRDRLPWVIAFPLRHTDFSPCEDVLEQAGLRVETWSRWGFPHRQFADAEERTAILDAISDSDVVGRPASRAHIEAVLYVARPEEDAERCALVDLVRSDPMAQADPRPGQRPGAVD